ncbi:sensor histidine kinase [Pseudoalteromonas citrea]|nr:sensor histidine kinase [Pseudoalteromonas citrea]
MATHSVSKHLALAEQHKILRSIGPLIFSLFYFFPMFSLWGVLSLHDLGLQVAIFICFIALYCVAVFKQGRDVTLTIILMLIVTSVGSLVTPGTSTLFGYIAPLCGFNYRRPYSFFMLGTMLFIMYLSSQFLITSNPLYFWAPALLISIGLFSFGVFERQERLHQIAHHMSQEKLEQLAAIAERERIARDLHDTLGHSLSSIALKAELASKLHDAGLQQKAVSESQQVAELARDLLSEVREAVSGLKQVGLYAQINLLEQRLMDAQFNVEQQLDNVDLKAEYESTLCFIAKELVTNILRHSDGKNVSIKLSQQETLSMRIFDDGKVDKFNLGNGLIGLKERVEALGATVMIDTKVGFAVTVEFVEEAL